MFTTILFYFIVVMLIAGAVINFILWMGELKDTYKHMAVQKHLSNELAKGKLEC